MYHPEGYATFKNAECKELADILWHYFKECGVMRDSDNIAEIYQAVEGVDQVLSALETRIDNLQIQVDRIETWVGRQ